MTDSFPGGLVAPQDLLNGIAPRAPNVPIDVIKHTLLTIVRDFCQHGGIWRDWVGPINLVPGSVAYSIELTDYKAALVSVLNGYLLSTELPLSPAYPYENFIEQTKQTSSTPQYFNQTPEGLVNIFPMIPEGTEDAVKLFVTMKPIDLCFPDWIRDKHYEALCDGVLGRLYLSPGPNYNADLGARFEKRYVSSRSRAGIKALTGGVNIHERVIPPPLFAPGSGLKARGSYPWGVAGAGRFR